MAFLVAACGPGSGDLGPTFDPTSTADLAAGGGASLGPILPAELAELTDLVVEVEVVDVQPSRLNTADGGFPNAADLAATAKEGHPLVGLEVFTPVDVRILGVAAAAPEVTPPGPGSFLVEVGGGAVTATLDTDQARLLGVLEVPDGAREGPGAVEVEQPATGPVDITWGYGPSAVLTEGARYVLFLARSEVERYDGSGTDLRWTVVDPAGVFEPTEDGGWKPQRDFASGPVALSDVVALVAGSKR